LKSIRHYVPRTAESVIVLLLLAAAAFLRFYRLDWQSLWLDELYTMREGDPRIPWSETISLVNAYENKSPLYFLFVKAIFILFGHTAYAARALSAIGGVVSVYVIYLLGRELFNTRAGIFAAAIACANPFLIFYSQEARSYIFIFLFAALSLLFFARALRNNSTWAIAWCALSNVIAVYLHAYALLLILAQGIMIIVLAAGEKSLRPYVKMILVYGVITLAGLLPILSSIGKSSSETTTWVPEPAPGFYMDYFFEYFGNADLIRPFLYMGLLGYFISLFLVPENTGPRSRKLDTQGVFLLFMLTLLSVFLVSYIFSITRIPALVIRYTILTLPVFICVLSAGFASLRLRQAGNLLAVSFLIVSVIHLFMVQKYYTLPKKTQFRELTQFLAANKPNQYPIVNSKTSWHNAYYMEKFGVTAPVIGEDREKFITTVLEKDTLPVFWMMGAHVDPLPPTESLKALEKKYTLLSSANFFDAWLRLYAVTPPDSIQVKLTTHNFMKENVAVIDNDTVVPLWEGTPRTTLPFVLPAGKFTISVIARGTPYKNIYPHINLLVDGHPAGSWFVNSFPGPSPNFGVKFEEPGSHRLSVSMDNDDNGHLSGSNEDRNAFVKMVLIEKQSD
jgi:uncharacterized membrane protein